MDCDAPREGGGALCKQAMKFDSRAARGADVCKVALFGRLLFW